MVRVAIKDMKGKLLRTLNGKCDNGSFIYNKASPIAFLPYGEKIWKGEEVKIPCDITKDLDLEENDRWFAFKFDGKNYTQIAPEDEFSNTRDYSDVSKYIDVEDKCALQEQIMLQKPKTLLENPICWMLVVGVMAVIIFSMINSGQTALSNSVIPMNKTANLLQAQVAMNQNNTVMLARMYNRTYQFMLTHCQG
jgi:hypothetical protein